MHEIAYVTDDLLRQALKMRGVDFHTIIIARFWENNIASYQSFILKLSF